MSKCREEFRHTIVFTPSFSTVEQFRIWQAAWNARGKVDAEICLGVKSPESENDPYAREAYIYATITCAEAIEQENEK